MNTDRCSRLQTTDSDIEKILQTSRTLPDTKEDDEYNRVNREATQLRKLLLIDYSAVSRHNPLHL